MHTETLCLNTRTLTFLLPVPFHSHTTTTTTTTTTSTTTQHPIEYFGALYTDEGSAYFHLTRNVIHKAPYWFFAEVGSIHDEVIDENWSDVTAQNNHCTRCTMQNNTFVTPGQQFPDEAQVIMRNAGPSWWPSKPWP